VQGPINEILLINGHSLRKSVVSDIAVKNFEKARFQNPLEKMAARTHGRLHRAAYRNRTEVKLHFPGRDFHFEVRPLVGRSSLIFLVEVFHDIECARRRLSRLKGD
jgi:hypothetical protein